VAGEGATVGTLGFELSFSAFGAGAFGGGERAFGLELGLAVLAEGIAFAAGIVADAPGLGARVGFGLAGAGDLGAGVGAGLMRGAQRVVAFAFGAGLRLARGCDLLIGVGLDGCGLRGSVTAELGELGGRVAGGVGGLLRCGLGGGGVVAGGGERFGEGAGFLAGFGLLGGGGDGGGLGAAAGCFGFGDLGADGGGVQAGGLLAGGAGKDGALPQEGVQGGERVSVAGGGRGGGCDAGVVVVAAGAFGAAELAVASAVLGGQRLPAAGPLADGGRFIAGRLAGHDGVPSCAGARDGLFFSFLIGGEMKRKARGTVRPWTGLRQWPGMSASAPR
jgi:hypothetical protein